MTTARGATGDHSNGGQQLTEGRSHAGEEQGSMGCLAPRMEPSCLKPDPACPLTTLLRKVARRTVVLAADHECQQACVVSC